MISTTLFFKNQMWTINVILDNPLRLKLLLLKNEIKWNLVLS